MKIKQTDETNKSEKQSEKAVRGYGTRDGGKDLWKGIRFEPTVKKRS